jgi:hypothetical protein
LRDVPEVTGAAARAAKTFFKLMSGEPIIVPALPVLA